LAQGDFDRALRGLLGDGAPLSAPLIARLKAGWQAEYERWKARSVADLEVVHLWVDGVYVKAGLEKEKAAILVVLAALRDGQKVILAVESGYRESTESWAAILRDLKRRGLQGPKLVIGDGHLGIWGALATVFPEAKEQRCWNHPLLNVLDKLPTKLQAEARSLLTKIPYAETREEAERHKRAFQAWCTRRGHAEVGRALDRDWERMMTFYQFPHEHWKHLRTSNPVESPFAAVRLRTAAAISWDVSVEDAGGKFSRQAPVRRLRSVSSLATTHRDGERERRALAHLALDPDPPAVQLDELPTQGQPQPRALHLLRRRSHLLELLEHLLLIFRSDADPGVAD
jgi:transposase-like protein